MSERPGPDWFTGGYAQEAFERHLTQFAGEENWHALQIGAYCGDASVWLLDHVVTGHRSWLVDVDTWEGSNEEAHHALDFHAVEGYYLDRVKDYTHLGRFKGTSDSYFAMQPASFDFIYIDGAHTTEQVLRDAIHADQYLKVGGIIAFDDYLWRDGSRERDVPRPAIDAFLRCYEQRYEVLEIGSQVWVRRTR